PGIPMAILYPKAEFLLVDSIGKKVKVAQAVADAVGLKNVTTLHARAEEVKLKEHIHKDKADLIISRAVTSLANFIPWVKGRYTEGILYLKGGNLEEEIAEAIKKCRMRPSQIFQKDISDWFSEEYFQEKKVLLIK
ncbi:MAG: class I SAM-dependent methyltransferase, partial [Bacteroidales bacterium]|nr:class I SAM-dependent methyltransferase [Bacteroidales bacterium]